MRKSPLLWKRGAAWLAFLGPFFFLTYGAVNYFTSTRSDVGIIVAAWERQLPFVPWLMLPYMSIDAFYGVSLFLFRKRSALDRHALRLLLATLISLAGFLLYPLQFSFAAPKVEGFNGALQTILLGFDKPYNQAPSLHISLLMILWVVYAKKLNSWAKLALHGWFLAIGISVILVYQHHFVDIWTGALVGLMCLYAIPDAPFAWRWNTPTRRMRSLGLRYSLVGGLLLVSGLILIKLSGVLALVLMWTAIALLLVAAAYYGLERQVFQRHKGIMRWPARLMLAPYLGSYISYRYYTRHLPACQKIYDNIWLGAFPRAQVIQMPWVGVLDMTNEFANAPINATLQHYLPTMDLTPPSPKVLVKAVRWLDNAQLHGNTLVHCALGLSRSASVVICWLVWRGHVASLQTAINLVTSQRNGVVLSAEHIHNIQQACLQLGCE